MKICFKLMVLLFIIIDQGIKLYIKNNMMEERYYILGGILGFHPKLNTKYSWINSLFDLRINRTVHIVVTIFLIIFLYIAYSFIQASYRSNPLFNLACGMVLAASICSLIDRVFWGGSLDYVLIKDLFIFDLKDVYVTVFEFVFIAFVLKNYNKIKGVSSKEIMHDFKQYVSGKTKKRGA